MNAGHGPSGPSLAEWSLEPLDSGAEPATSSEPHVGPARFHAESRSRNDRRAGGDRRETLRFEPDRRSGNDRRPRMGWEPGKNL
jgi:hypothetical protein